jgi:hypothetical protein
MRRSEFPWFTICSDTLYFARSRSALNPLPSSSIWLATEIARLPIPIGKELVPFKRTLVDVNDPTSGLTSHDGVALFSDGRTIAGNTNDEDMNVAIISGENEIRSLGRNICHLTSPAAMIVDEQTPDLEYAHSTITWLSS